LKFDELLISIALSSIVLFAVELEKFIANRMETRTKA